MIDRKTMDQLDTFLLEAMQQALGDNFQNSLCNVKPSSGISEGKKYNQFILITISSIRFKCLVFLHFQESSDFHDFIYDAMGITNKTTNQLFYDNLSEIGNAIAGFFKRKLECSFSVIGMSTPKLLSQNALSFFLKSRPVHVTKLEAELDGRFCLGGSLLLYIDKNYQFDLKASGKNEDDLESGELLLF